MVAGFPRSGAGLSATGALRLEIAVASAAGASVAIENGADRIELCTALELGGLTPSAGLVEEAVATGAPVHVLIRCRPGDFVYDASELATMHRDVRLLAGIGVSGVVIGALTEAGDLDRDATRRLVEAARAASDAVQVTFHRAVDVSADPVALVAALADLGIDRVLTSGGTATAGDGAVMLRRMSGARGSVELMAGGGITPETIGAVVEAGATSVHLSAKKRVELRSGGVPLGAADDGGSYFVTDPAAVRRARESLDMFAL